MGRVQSIPTALVADLIRKQQDKKDAHQLLARRADVHHSLMRE